MSLQKEILFVQMYNSLCLKGKNELCTDNGCGRWCSAYSCSLSHSSQYLSLAMCTLCGSILQYPIMYYYPQLTDEETGSYEAGKWQSQRDLNQISLTLVLMLSPPSPRTFSRKDGPLLIQRAPKGSDWPDKIFSVGRMTGPLGRGEGQ